jgi:cytochrome c553
MKRAPLNASCLALALALTSLAAPAFAKGDIAKGKTLAYTCTGCHGIVEYKNAYPSYRVPKIAGQNEQYIIAALTGYKKHERNHPTMQAQAQSFSDADIANIAAYLASLKHSK